MENNSVPMGHGVSMRRYGDEVYLPSERIKATCLIHREVEQLIHDIKVLVQSNLHESGTAEVTCIRLDEAQTYMFILGEELHAARRELEKTHIPNPQGKA